MYVYIKPIFSKYGLVYSETNIMKYVQLSFPEMFQAFDDRLSWTLHSDKKIDRILIILKCTTPFIGLK